MTLLKSVEHNSLHEIKDALFNKDDSQQALKHHVGSMKTHKRRLAKLKRVHFGTTYNFLKNLFEKITDLSR